MMPPSCALPACLDLPRPVSACLGSLARHLKGEAQCIDRIMECFAHEVFSQCQGDLPFKSADAAFVMSFGLIMLNTDLHNPRYLALPISRES